MRAGVVVFPGTNCDRDTFMACEEFGFDTQYLWHFETDLSGYDVIFLPGGFSYGDYIRSGRLAKFSPIMQAVKDFIDKKQGMVVGICNGFQILCECGFLPGVLTDNESTRFVCKSQELNFNGKNISLPIAHGEGRYVADSETLEILKSEDMIFLTYQGNPNGSMLDIAGLYDKKNRIIGMMPHPERAFFDETGGVDGREIFKIIQEGLEDVKCAN
jgi:phosphoribosylformylglycinamidine synthase